MGTHRTEESAQAIPASYISGNSPGGYGISFMKKSLPYWSKLSAIAGTLAALMYGAVPYYAGAEKYIDPPADELVSVLAMLSEKNGVLSQKEFIIRLEDKGLLKDVTGKRRNHREVTKKGYAKARRQYFEKLEEKGWALKKGKGRSSNIEITKKYI